MADEEVVAADQHVAGPTAGTVQVATTILASNEDLLALKQSPAYLAEDDTNQQQTFLGIILD